MNSIIPSQVPSDGSSQFLDVAAQLVEARLLPQAFLVVATPQNADGRAAPCVHRPGVRGGVANVYDPRRVQSHLLAAKQYAVAVRLGPRDGIGAVDGREPPIDAIVLVAGPRVVRRRALGAVRFQHGVGVLHARVREGPQLQPDRRAAATTAPPHGVRPPGRIIASVQPHEEVADADVESGGRSIHQLDVILVELPPEVLPHRNERRMTGLDAHVTRQPLGGGVATAEVILLGGQRVGLRRVTRRRRALALALAVVVVVVERREARRSNDDDGEDFRASTPTAVIVLRLPPRKPSTVAIAALINTAARATLPKAIMQFCSTG